MEHGCLFPWFWDISMGKMMILPWDFDIYACSDPHQEHGHESPDVPDVAGTPTSVMEERLQTRHIRHPSALVLVGRIMTLDEPALMTFLVDH